jgi:carbonic anhydrase
MSPPFPHPRTPAEALEVLLEGNRRHREGRLELRDHSPASEERAGGQQPFAAIVTCADSRLSTALIFDLEPGNLFVSRVAGNGVDAGTLGSTEFAVAVLGVKLVMVMGHSDCGAVRAAISVADGSATYPADRYGVIGAMVDRIVRVVEALPAAERTLEGCVAANVRAQVSVLAARDPVIRPAVEAGTLAVVGAVYDIASSELSLV